MPTTLYHGGYGGQALLVDGDRIAWLGAGQADPGGVDERVDLAGGWVAPAFVDAHVHATSTGLALTGLDLTGCPSLADCLRQVEQHSRRARGGAVLGTGWDQTRWPEGRPPTAAELDRASYGGVVYLARTDVHSAVASSALLAATPGAQGLPGYLGDGLVRQAAHHAVRRTALGAITRSQREQAQRAALDHAASLGIGSVHECGGPDISGEEDFLAVMAMDHPVERVGYWGERDVERARELGAAGAAGDLFVDGAVGSHTACLSAPYQDTGELGHRYLEADEIAAHVLACTRAGLQAGFHAIGDAAVASVAEAFDRAAAELGVAEVRAARHRVEHVEMVSPADIAVLARCGVVASVQPAFDAAWGGEQGMYAARLSAARARAMNPFAALQAAGVVLALGSDSPVTPPDPWGGVRAAVEHRTPGSGLTPAQALAAHTDGGRWAARQPPARLRQGGPATFAVWARGPEGGAPVPDLSDGGPACLRTVVAGRTAFGGAR